MRPKRTWSVGAVRAMLTRKDSEWKGKFEEPWQSRPHLWRGVGHVFLQGRVKGLCIVPLTRQGGDALRAWGPSTCNIILWAIGQEAGDGPDSLHNTRPGKPDGPKKFEWMGSKWTMFHSVMGILLNPSKSGGSNTKLKANHNPNICCGSSAWSSLTL